MSQCIDTFIKFDGTFLNGLTFPESSDANFDTAYASAVCNFLFNKRSFAESSAELDEIKTALNYKINVCGASVFNEYLEAKRLTGERSKSISVESGQTYGDEDVENTTFDPVVSGTQAEVKLTGSHSTKAGDGSASETTETEDNVDNVDLKDFWDKLRAIVATEFCQFVNTMLFGGC